MMKWILYLSLLFSAHCSYSQWEHLTSFNAGNDTINIMDFHFFDADEGLILGRRVANVNRAPRAYILRTTDGAITWDTIQTFTDTVLVKIDFPSENVGFISAVSPSPVATIEIFKSTNGGQSWTELPNNGINQTGMVHTMHFYDEEVGIVSRSGYSWITHDGGDSWDLISTNPHGGAPFTSLEDGVFTGVGGALLLYSEDTCQTYTVDTIFWGGSANNVTFHQNHFYISVLGNNGNSLGYPHFNYGILVNYNKNSEDIIIVHFPEKYTRQIYSNGGYLLAGCIDLTGQGEQILKSIDNGQTWYTQEIIESNLIYSLGIQLIQCVNDTTCFATDRDRIYKTTNGGGPLIEQVGHQVFLGTDENVKQPSNLSIYPNPTNNQVSISSSQTIQKVSIVDLNGRLVYSANPNGLKTTIQVGSLSRGVYVVHVQTTEAIFRRKIVKQ